MCGYEHRAKIFERFARNLALTGLCPRGHTEPGQQKNQSTRGNVGPGKTGSGNQNRGPQDYAGKHNNKSKL